MSLPDRRKDRWDALTRGVKIAGLRAQRHLAWIARAEAFGPPRLADPLDPFPFVAWRREEPARREGPGTNPLFEDGKLHNLRLAAPAFDGLLLEPGRPFSFWRTLGEASEARGFRHGMELAGGCVVPAVGGGLCLLSNALFRMAVERDAVLIERHGHSVSAVPEAPGEPWGYDATVFYPYVDLRFEMRERTLLSVVVTRETLRVEVRVAHPSRIRVAVRAQDDRTAREGQDLVRTNRLVRRRFDGERLLGEDVVAVNRKRLTHPEEVGRSCLTCGEVTCHLRPRELPRIVELHGLRRRA